VQALLKLAGCVALQPEEAVRVAIVHCGKGGKSLLSSVFQEHLLLAAWRREEKGKQTARVGQVDKRTRRDAALYLPQSSLAGFGCM
jgi:hypothetical protein